MRAVVATAIGHDPGEPHNLEDVRVAVSADGAATLTFRDHVVAFAELPTCPPGSATPPDGRVVPVPPQPSTSDNRTMAASALARHAGPIALAAGAALALVDLARWVLERPDDRVGMMADPAVPRRQRRLLRRVHRARDRARRPARAPRAALRPLRLIAFLAAFVGTMTQGGNMWFDGFAGPWLAEVAPQVFAAEKTITLVVGAMSAYVCSPWAGCCSGSPCCAPASCRWRCRWGWSSAVCSGSGPDCRRSASRSAWPSPRWAPR